MAHSSARPQPVLNDAPEIELRALKTNADYAACVELQRQTWGATYADCVPASVLKVSQYVGGVCGGAFAEDGRLLGFVYGLTGIRDGHVIHWSHMLAVMPEYRNHGVGRRLKEYQREVLKGHGIEMMYWTFDPLVARNAHLNINRLGTQVQDYVPDMYGNTGSELHAFGTDRFVVRWEVAGGARAGGGESSGSAGAIERVEIPVDVESMAVSEAKKWRAATRPQFVRLFSEGYRVVGFESDAGRGCFYVLTRTQREPGAG